MLPAMVTLPEVVMTDVMPPGLLSPRTVTAPVNVADTLPVTLVELKFAIARPVPSDAPVAEFTFRVPAVIVPAFRFTWPVVEVRLTAWPAAETLALSCRVPSVEIVIGAPDVLVEPEMVSATVLPVKVSAPVELLIWRFETARPDVRF